MIANGPDTASRPAAQRDRMRARNIAMPNSRVPSKYRAATRPFTTGMAPRLTSLGVPVRTPKKPATNFGDSVANSGKIRGSMNAKHI